MRLQNYVLSVLVAVASMAGACDSTESGAADGGGPDTALDGDVGDTTGGADAADDPSDAGSDGTVDVVDEGVDVADGGGDAEDGGTDEADLEGEDLADSGGESDGGDGGLVQIGTPCFLSEEAVGLVGELAVDLFRGTDWVVRWAGPFEAAYALGLVGGDRISLATAFLIGPCTEPTTYDPYCSETFEDTSESLCSRLGCEAADVITAEVWFAESGHTGVDDHHAFSYATTAPPGTATYDPNPYLAWRLDVSSEQPTVSASVDVGLTVEVDGGGTYDLSHAGTVTATRVSDEQNTIDVALSFPELDGDGASFGLDFGLDETDTVSGTLTRDDAVIAEVGATLVGDEPALTLTWTCPE